MIQLSVCRFRNAVEGEKILFCAKMTDLNGEWVEGIAEKKGEAFSVVLANNPDQAIIYNNDDEHKSLISDNLWTLGWYKLRETGPTDATGNNCYNYDGVLAIDDSSVVLIKEFKGAFFL